MSTRTEFLKGFASFRGTSVQEADQDWQLLSMNLPAEERQQAEEMGYRMGIATAELFAHLFRDTDAHERDTKNAGDVPSA